MSAFVCSPAHIGLLAVALARNYTTLENADLLAARLMRENITSVAYRYPSDKGNGDRPGWSLPDDALIEAAVLYARHYTEHWPDEVSPIDLHNMARCYGYQSCEHPDWRESIAYQLVSRIADYPPEKPGAEHVRWEYEGEMLPEVEEMFA